MPNFDEQAGIDWHNKLVREHNALTEKNAALRARVAELETAADKQREIHQKWMRERPIAPHPVDQLNNLSKALHEDAEAECAVLRARVAELERALRGCTDDVEAWCKAIDENGTGWDDWDDHYKGFWYRGGLASYRAALAKESGNG